MEIQDLNHKNLATIKRRKFIYRFFYTIGMGALGLKLWDLQILNVKTFKDLSSNNRIRIKLVAAPRGSIYDANDVVLATNIPSYNVVIDRSHITKHIAKQLKKISLILDTDVKNLLYNIERSKNNAFFSTALLKQNISFKEAYTVSVLQDEFPGVTIDYDIIRVYPLGEATSHLLGFINWSSSKDTSKIPTKQLASWRKIGQSGVEGAYNGLIIGNDGSIENEVNATGRNIRILQEKLPKPGENLYLTIDSKLQSFIYQNLPNNGAVIVMDANRSDVIAMVSKPGFDPNIYADGISQDEWSNSLDSNKKSFNDLCIRGIYSPGSSFKLSMAVAGLTSGAINSDHKVACRGYFKDSGATYKCWKTSGHGSLNLVQAIENSCNVYFYDLAKKMGINTMVEFAKRFGFGQKTGVDLPNELSGILPSPRWKKLKLNQIWHPGDTINIGVGQGYISTTPLQNIVYLNSIVNGGKIMQPNLLKSKSDVSNIIKNINISNDILDEVKEGISLCVNSPNGTGRAAFSQSLKIAGKTGTTQVISFETKEKILSKKGFLDEKFKSHAWFIGYVPSFELMPDKKLYTIAVLLENAGDSAYAAAFAKKVLEFMAARRPTHQLAKQS